MVFPAGGQLAPKGLTAVLQPWRRQYHPGLLLLTPPQKWAGFVSKNVAMCAAVWPQERRKGGMSWGVRRAPALLALGQTQGWGMSSPI